MLSHSSVLALVVLSPALAAQERSLFKTESIQHLLGLSSPGFEAKPDISHDKLTLHYASDQAGGVGDLDLWVATRPTTDAQFGPQSNVTELNSTGRDHTPTTNTDLTFMIFSSNRAGGVGTDDAWMTTRAGASSPWDPPTNLPGISSTERDMGFTMTPDGLVLYFTSNRPGVGGFDLFTTTRPDTASLWAAPTPVAELNTVFDDKFPTVTGDNLTLYFASNRLGGVPDASGFPTLDIWVAMRASTSDSWSVVENVLEVNTEYSEYLLSVADDDSELYYVSDRPPVLGSFDLFTADAVASVKRYGAGIGGTAGVPFVRPVGGDPVVGNLNWGFEITNVSDVAWGVYGASAAPDTSLFLISLAGPFTNQLFQSALAVNPPPEVPRIVSTPIPDVPGLVGVTTFCQILMFDDPNGSASFLGFPIATSAGIRRTILP